MNYHRRKRPVRLARRRERGRGVRCRCRVPLTSAERIRRGAAFPVGGMIWHATDRRPEGNGEGIPYRQTSLELESIINLNH